MLKLVGYEMNAEISLADMAKRLQSLEDRLAIVQLEGAYSTLYDSRDGDAWAELFTEDGIYQGRRLDGMPELNFIQGRKALAQFCLTNKLSCIHYLNVPDIRLEGDNARGRVNFVFRGFEASDRHWTHITNAEGYYDVAYQRTPEGWKIRRRFTVYFERGQKTVYGYELTEAPFEERNPPINGNGELMDRR